MAIVKVNRGKERKRHGKREAKMKREKLNNGKREIEASPLSKKAGK